MTVAPVSAQTGAEISRIVPFDSRRHAGLGLDHAALGRFTASRNAVTIGLTEFFYASRDYPIVFVKSAQDTMLASVVTGFRQDENLFVDSDGAWHDRAYLPAYVRRYPFFIADAGNDPGRDKTPILVDEAALEASQDPYFDPGGRTTDKWDKMEKFIADFVAEERLTRAFTSKIEALGLLEYFEAQINPEQHNKMQVSGMYRVNEDRLNRLPAKVIRDLMLKGELSRIYAHLISLENFAKLLDLSAMKGQAAAGNK